LGISGFASVATAYAVNHNFPKQEIPVMGTLQLKRKYSADEMHVILT